MDILSLTASAVGVGIPSRTAPSAGSNPPISAAEGPPPKAPPGTGQTTAVPQKEATPDGLKSPENLLDLLKTTANTDTSGNTASFALALDNPLVSATLKGIKLPPSTEDLMRALAALGFAVPQPTSQSGQPVQGIPDAVVKAVSQVQGLPQAVLATLTNLLKQASAAPVPAANLIDMARANTPTPQPAVHSPATLGDPTVETPRRTSVPSPHAQSGPTFQSDLPRATSGEQVLDPATVQELNVTAITGKADSQTAAEVLPTVEMLMTPSKTSGSFPDPASVPPKGAPQPLPVVEPDPSAATAGTSEEEVSVVEAQGLNVQVLGSNISQGKPKPTSGGGVASDNGSKATPKPNSSIPQPTSGKHTGNEEPLPVEKLGKPDPAQIDHPDKTSDSPKPTSGKGPAPEPKPVEGGRPQPVQGSPVDKPHKTSSDVSDDGLDPTSASVPQTDTAVPTAQAQAQRQVDPTQVSKPVAAVNPLPKAALESVTSQVADRLESMILGKKSGTVAVKLNPTDLGTITMTVRSFGTKIDTDIKASDDSVRAALQMHRADLAQNIQSRGLNLNSFTVGHESSGSGHQQQGAADFTEAQRNAQLRATMTASPVTVAPTAASLRPRLSAVDYTV